MDDKTKLLVSIDSLHQALSTSKHPSALLKFFYQDKQFAGLVGTDSSIDDALRALERLMEKGSFDPKLEFSYTIDSIHREGIESVIEQLGGTFTDTRECTLEEEIDLVLQTTDDE